MRADLKIRAREMDESDPLRSFRDLFYVPTVPGGDDIIYLVGNSLGLQPKSVHSYVSLELEKWRRLGVAGHFEGDEPWLNYHESVCPAVAALVGGLPHEVVVMNSLTVNLHLMMATFFQPSGTRSRIVMEANAFPSDRYAVESHLRFRGLSPDDHLIELNPRSGEDILRTEDILRVMEDQTDQISLVVLGGLNYYSGQVLDMEVISRTGQTLNIPVGFDLAHAVGNVPLHLHEWGCDFAVWCSYKYLNAGPGAIAGAFIHERHARDSTKNRLAGWWGHDPATRFEMPPTFAASESADGWQVSGPPILQLAALRASLEIFETAGMDALHEKRRRLSAFMREVLADVEGPFRIITPSAEASAGCQLSIFFERHSREIFEALEANGVACDYREPNVVRIAAVPLYNSYSDVVRFGEILERVCI
ncbi:MAG: kynureninase [Rhodothermales bacterium]